MFRKSFQIELEDSLTYPSARIICEAVESYAAGSKERLTFVSREMPVSFYLDQDLYEVKVDVRGNALVDSALLADYLRGKTLNQRIKLIFAIEAFFL